MRAAPNQSTRRGAKLARPAGGWPKRPKGRPEDLPTIVSLVMPFGVNQSCSSAVSSRTDVERFIVSIACDLLKDLKASAESPTLSETRERLDEIRKAAKDLDRRLSMFAGPRGLLRAVALESGFFRQAVRDQRVEYDLIDWDEILAKPLQALAAAAAAYQVELRETAKQGAGRERLYERLFGDPRLRLARNCAWLIKEVQGGDLPITEGGVALELMGRIWQFATGDAAPDELLTHEAEAGSRAVRDGLQAKRVPPKLEGLIKPKIGD